VGKSERSGESPDDRVNEQRRRFHLPSRSSAAGAREGRPPNLCLGKTHPDRYAVDPPPLGGGSTDELDQTSFS
jgi:hypothetical protein